MIYNISKTKNNKSTSRAKSFLLHSDNEMLPICYNMFGILLPYKKIRTATDVRRSYSRYSYADFYHKVKRYRNLNDNFSDKFFSKIFISKSNLILGRDFAYDIDVNKVLYAVVAPNELVVKGGAISSDQCLLYISDHIANYTPSFKKELLGLFENFLGDMVITKYPNQMVLGHPFFKPKSKKEINEALKVLINEL